MASVTETARGGGGGSCVLSALRGARLKHRGGAERREGEEELREREELREGEEQEGEL